MAVSSIRLILANTAGVLLDLLPIALLLLLFWGAKIKPVNDRASFASVAEELPWRGFFAIVIIVHHVAQHTSSGIVFPYFTYVGFLAVAVFFLYSGFGLMKRYLSDPQYAQWFLAKRLPKLLLPYLAVTVLFWLLYLWLENPWTLTEVAKGALTGSPIVWHSWYINVIVGFYIVFWLLMKVARGQAWVMLGGALIWYGASVVIFRQLGFGEWWYNASHILVLGMLIAVYEKPIVRVFAKFAWPVVITSVGLLFAGLNYIEANQLLSDDSAELEAVLIQMVAAVVFSIGLCALCTRISIGNAMLRFLGEYALEIYLLQGLFQFAFRSELAWIENDFSYLVTSVVATVLSAALLNLCLKPIFGVYLRSLRKITR